MHFFFGMDVCNLVLIPVMNSLLLITEKASRDLSTHSGSRDHQHLTEELVETQILGPTPGLPDWNQHLTPRVSTRKLEEPGSRADSDEVKSGRQAASYQAVCSKIYSQAPVGLDFQEKAIKGR